MAPTSEPWEVHAPALAHEERVAREDVGPLDDEARRVEPVARRVEDLHADAGRLEDLAVAEPEVDGVVRRLVRRDERPRRAADLRDALDVVGVPVRDEDVREAHAEGFDLAQQTGHLEARVHDEADAVARERVHEVLHRAKLELPDEHASWPSPASRKLLPHAGGREACASRRIAPATEAG